MDFAWNEEQVDLYNRVLAFAQGLNLENASDVAGFRRLWAECGAFGLFGLSVPERYGGLGLDALSTARAMEAFGRGCVDTGLVFSVAAHSFACVIPVLEHGGDALKHRVLPMLCDGRWIAANAISEAEAGSDVFALRCRATRDGNTYVLDGTKSFVTNGPVGDALVVYATTNPDHGLFGISGFLVERSSAGVTVGEPFKKIGLETSPISQVYFDNCRVPVENMLGAEGTGARAFMSSMHWERTCLFAGYLGMMERQLGQVIDYAKARKQGGKAIGKHQAVSHKIADMKLRLDAARFLLYRACWLRDRGESATLEVSLAKVAVSEAAIKSSLDAIQIHGGLGVMAEGNVERMLRDAVPASIFSGTSEIQRNLIAQELGL